jgi:hypothetical protein
MERNIQSHSEQLKPVLLYRDDIEQIVELLREVSPNVELSTDEHKFNDVKEWADLKRDYFTNMLLKTRNPYVYVGLSKNSVHLYIAEDTPQSRGTFEKIKRFLMDRKAPGQKLLNPSMPPLVFNLPLYAFLFLPGPLRDRDWTSISVTGILMLGCVWWWWLAIQSRLRKYSVIVPKYRIDAPNFWKRNSDKIVLVIISALIGSLLTLLIKSLTTKGP